MSKEGFIKILEEVTSLTYIHHEDMWEEDEGEERIKDIGDILEDIERKQIYLDNLTKELEALIKKKEIKATPIFVEDINAEFCNCSFGPVIFLVNGSIMITSCEFYPDKKKTVMDYDEETGEGKIIDV